MISCSHFNVFSKNRQLSVGTKISYHKPLPQSSPFNKEHYNPVRTTIYLGILLEMRRRNRQRKFSFKKAVILIRILNIIKSTLTGLPCISTLSVNKLFLLEFLEFWFRFQALLYGIQF